MMLLRVVVVLLFVLVMSQTVSAQSPREQAQVAIGTLVAPQSSTEQRVQAAQRLGELGAWDGVTALASTLDDPAPSVRAAAANALYDLHEHAAPVLPALKARLSEADPDALYPIVLVLAKLDVPDTELRAARMRLLREGEPFHRFYTARALADELSAVDVVPHVLAALQAFAEDGRSDTTFRDAQKLLEVLVDSDGELIAPQLIAALEHDHPTYIDAIGVAIHRMPKPLPAAVPKLIVHLGNEPEPSNGLMIAVLRQGSHARTALPVLHRRFREETNEMTRKQLAETMMAVATTLRPLGSRIELGPADPALVTEVWSMIGQAGLDDPSRAVRSGILRTDSIWGAQAEPARAILAQAARSDPEPRNRATAVVSLGALGAASLPLLREILQSEDEQQVLDAARREVARLVK